MHGETVKFNNEQYSFHTGFLVLMCLASAATTKCNSPKTQGCCKTLPGPAAACTGR